MRTKKKSFCLLKEIAIVLILSIIILFPFLYNLESRSFHGDENLWLRATTYFKLFFINKDIHNKHWRAWPAIDQPPIGKYVIGFSLLLAGYRSRLDEVALMEKWAFSKDYNWNVLHGRMPPKEILLVGRYTMAIIGSLACLLLYCLGRMTFNIGVGAIAAILLAFNPLMLRFSQRVMTDAPLIFFLIANTLLIMFFYNFILKHKSRKSLLISGLIGLTIALATGTKLNGGITGIVFLAFCFYLIIIKVWQYKSSTDIPLSVLAILNKDYQVKIILISLLISISTSIFVFVALNPFLYHKPIKGSLDMIKSRAESVKVQQKEAPRSAITSIGQKFYFVIRRTLLPGTYGTLNAILKIPIDFILFLVGLFILIYKEGRNLLNYRRPSNGSILIFWTIITFILIMAWIPLDWNRYYLPIVPCITMVTGYAIEKVSSSCWVILKQIRIV
jgi:hypothetical protein